ncbi:hypothetical protein E4188_16755 [Aeromonas media]|uniref:Uncharacterized protein n=1 Tax=Aeromonas media TaxID=651 RepID=A0ABX6NUB3_AERME|nr:hypothetical protein E4187_08600 [Aeromonas media]QJT39978.1 hypothetical protein E4188_16755 [Aeromonas media]
MALLGSAPERKAGHSPLSPVCRKSVWQGGGAIWRDRPLALGVGSGIVLRQQDRFGRRSRRRVRQAGRLLPSARL